MYARVARFEGADPENIRRMVDAVKSRAESGPPEGVPAVGFLMLHQAEQGNVLNITLFETEDDLRQGDEALSAMDPPIQPAEGTTRAHRASVETYEVGIKLDA